MPSFITHMLIARQAKARLEHSGDAAVASFVSQVLAPYEAFYLLGSIGPDMPYFENLLVTAWQAIWDKAYKAKGMEPYSYQLHSKQPNEFALRLFEITWKESDLNRDEWDEIDKSRFAFCCGYLCHIATDHVIHPFVQRIAGPYYKRTGNKSVSAGSRSVHADCETSQDLYLLAKDRKDQRLSWGDFVGSGFHLFPRPAVAARGDRMLHLRYWLSLRAFLNLLAGVRNVYFSDELVFLVEKAFVEANNIDPGAARVLHWLQGTLAGLRLAQLPFGVPHAKAYARLFRNNVLNIESDAYHKYILYEGLGPDAGDYDLSVANAVSLCQTYLGAAHKFFDSDEWGPDQRERFKAVIQDADLTYPLDKDIKSEADAALRRW